MGYIRSNLSSNGVGLMLLCVERSVLYLCEPVLIAKVTIHSRGQVSLVEGWVEPATVRVLSQPNRKTVCWCDLYLHFALSAWRVLPTCRASDLDLQALTCLTYGEPAVGLYWSIQRRRVSIVHRSRQLLHGSMSGYTGSAKGMKCCLHGTELYTCYDR
jgi:hypothetical protein